jgi:hypothetical protein
VVGVDVGLTIRGHWTIRVPLQLEALVPLALDQREQVEQCGTVTGQVGQATAVLDVLA